MPVIARQAAKVVIDPGFGDSLATWQQPVLRRPLAHSVSRSSPAGILHGVPAHLRDETEPIAPMTVPT